MTTSDLIRELQDRLSVCREARAVERRTLNQRVRLDSLRWQAVWILNTLRRYKREGRLR